jgi:hypothetical protein
LAESLTYRRIRFGFGIDVLHSIKMNVFCGLVRLWRIVPRST